MQSMDSEIKRLQMGISEMSHELDSKGKEILKVRSEANIAVRSVLYSKIINDKTVSYLYLKGTDNNFHCLICWFVNKCHLFYYDQTIFTFKNVECRKITLVTHFVRTLLLTNQDVNINIFIVAVSCKIATARTVKEIWHQSASRKTDYLCFILEFIYRHLKRAGYSEQLLDSRYTNGFLVHLSSGAHGFGWQSCEILAKSLGNLC